jgi:hypothetical protein
MAELAWHSLPELPPHREPKTAMRPGGRLIVSEPTDRVMVRTDDNGTRQALYHHATGEFWTLGEERDHRLDGVTAWAFEPRPNV